MSNRERWIIYPLLVMALGASLRDKFLPPDLKARELAAEKIRCNRLEVGTADCQRLKSGVATCEMMTVAAPDGADGMRLGSVDGQGGRLEVCGKQGRTVLVASAGSKGQAGALETFTADEVPLVELGSTEGGGLVSAAGRGGKVFVALGHEGENLGVFARVPGLRGLLPLGTPLRLTTKAASQPGEHETRGSAEDGHETPTQPQAEANGASGYRPAQEDKAASQDESPTRDKPAGQHKTPSKDEPPPDEF